MSKELMPHRQSQLKGWITSNEFRANCCRLSNLKLLFHFNIAGVTLNIYL